MTFRQAVIQTPGLEAAYQPGLQALGNDSYSIICQDPHCLIGSVNLDEALRSRYPERNRWDYGIGIRSDNQEKAMWVEVHPASTRDVDTVLRKFSWLKNWLANEGIALREITLPNAYYWIARSGVHITKNSPASRKLALRTKQRCRKCLVQRNVSETSRAHASDGLKKRPTNRELRKSSRKKRGGQAGHEGQTLKAVAAELQNVGKNPKPHFHLLG